MPKYGHKVFVFRDAYCHAKSERIDSAEHTYETWSADFYDFFLGICASIRLKIHPAYLFHLNRKDIPDFLAGLPPQPDLSTSEDDPPAPIPFDPFLPVIDLDIPDFPDSTENQALV